MAAHPLLRHRAAAEDILRNADKVIFPGVGEASTAMSYLRDKELDSVIKNLTQPVLGICIGLQLMCNHTEEGNTTGMGIFDTQVKRFKMADDSALKIPHMGWNLVNKSNDSLLTKDFDNFDEVIFDFVHSYFVKVEDEKNSILKTNYGVEFDSAIQKDNIFGAQFHPEKSHKFGMKLFENFARI